MQNTRKFSGIWIPKDIWLDSRLTMLDKGILMEIDSLDNEQGCCASNAYLAEFCGCSESNITKTISLLKELGYIYQASFDGRTRILKSNLDKTQSKQTNKFYESASENLRPYNNVSNDTLNNKNTFSKEKDICSSGKKTLLTINLPKKEQKPKVDKNKILAENVKKNLTKFQLNTTEIELLGKWIDELYFKNKGIGNDALSVAVKHLLEIDVDKREEVIQIATLNAWRDFKYCLNDEPKDKLHINSNVIVDSDKREESLQEVKSKIKDGGEKDVDYY